MSLINRVVFRVDESDQFGFGHMSRCRALADALKQYGAVISFCCRSLRQSSRTALEMSGVIVVDLVDDQDFLAQDLRSSIVVVDGYQFGADFWQRLLTVGASCTVCIDDFRAIPYQADIVICYNEGVSAEKFDLAPQTRLFLGGRYLLLRPEILAAARQSDGPAPRRALMIAAGGTRQESWIAKMLTYLSRIEPGVTLWVLSGRRLSVGKVLHEAKLRPGQVRFFSGLDANAMIRLYRQARCLIAPASTVMLEAFSAGCPLVSGWVVENQRNSLDCYDRQGLIVNAGDLQMLSLRNMTLAYAKARRQSLRMVRRQRVYISESKSGVDEIVLAILIAACRNTI